jgi:hypothetical protein
MDRTRDGPSTAPPNVTPTRQIMNYDWSIGASKEADMNYDGVVRRPVVDFRSFSRADRPRPSATDVALARESSVSSFSTRSKVGPLSHTVTVTPHQSNYCYHTKHAFSPVELRAGPGLVISRVGRPPHTKRARWALKVSFFLSSPRVLEPMRRSSESSRAPPPVVVVVGRARLLHAQNQTHARI